MRRLPPNKIEQSLSGLLNLIPQETDELLQRVDQPLEEAVDPEAVSTICLRYSINYYYLLQTDTILSFFILSGKKIFAL